MKRLEIAVAGCGPAGLAAALFLARAGHRVTLFDRFAAPAPVGSGLLIQPVGKAVLAALGLDAALAARGARIDRLDGRAVPSGARALDVGYAALGSAVHATGIHRASLFDILFDAVRAEGIAIETGRPVTGSTSAAGGKRSLLLGAHATLPFDLVVDALGSRSPLVGAPMADLRFGALWVTLPFSGPFPPDALSQRYRGAHQMAGVLPTGRRDGATPELAFFWSLRHADHDRWRLAGMAAWVDEVAALWPEAAPLAASVGGPDALTMARYGHRTLKTPVEPGLVHIGDAWHSTSPQLGQGANMALLDAAGLSAALASTVETGDALRRFIAIRGRHVALYQGMSRLFTPLYQSDSRALPVLRDIAVGTARLVPGAAALQAAMVSGRVGRPLRRIGLRPH